MFFRSINDFPCSLSYSSTSSASPATPSSSFSAATTSRWPGPQCPTLTLVKLYSEIWPILPYFNNRYIWNPSDIRYKYSKLQYLWVSSILYVDTVLLIRFLEKEKRCSRYWKLQLFTFPCRPNGVGRASQDQPDVVVQLWLRVRHERRAAGVRRQRPHLLFALSRRYNKWSRRRLPLNLKNHTLGLRVLGQEGQWNWSSYVLALVSFHQFVILHRQS